MKIVAFTVRPFDSAAASRADGRDAAAPLRGAALRGAAFFGAFLAAGFPFFLLIVSPRLGLRPLTQNAATIGASQNRIRPRWPAAKCRPRSRAESRRAPARRARPGRGRPRRAGAP